MRGTIAFTSDAVDFLANSPQFEELFRHAPVEAVFQVRSAVGRFFGRHRRTLKDNLRSSGQEGLASAVGKGWAPYRVLPYQDVRSEAELRQRLETAATPGSNANAVISLDRVTGHVRLDSPAEVAHELGATITGNGLLAVPQGPFAGLTTQQRKRRKVRTPASYSRSALAKDQPLFAIPAKRSGTEAYLARRKAGEKKEAEVVYALRRSVQIEPNLGVSITWDQLEDYRARVLSEHADRFVEGLEALFEKMKAFRDEFDSLRAAARKAAQGG